MQQDDVRPGADAVRGVDLDAQSRCAHYHGAADIVAIKFMCCGVYYACTDCHAALADHPAQVWPADRWDERAIRCGACASTLTIATYLDGTPACPVCGAGFNPRCRSHHHYYFAVPAE